eukprot:GHVQ01032165.1.p1 GENE.GHVQ01032165.1~~GHVQ01032165.1.p1  ORF type:complete len:384 (+),score=49.95 GHVQ01032165.1:1355-2506(+)
MELTALLMMFFSPFGMCVDALTDLSFVLVVVPTFYFLLSFSHWMIGEKIRAKLSRVGVVIRRWMNVMSVLSFSVGLCMHLWQLRGSVVVQFGGISLDEGSIWLGGLTIVLSMCLGCVSGFVVFVVLIWCRPYGKVNVVAEEECDRENLDMIVRTLRMDIAAIKKDLQQENYKTAVYTSAEEQAAKRPKLPEPEKSVGSTPEKEIEMEVEKHLLEEKLCVRCGQGDHKSVECIYNKMHCNKCGLRGHKAVVCKHIAYADTQGRVNTRIEDRPGSVRVYQRRDKTQKDHLMTAGNVLELLHEGLKHRAKQAKRHRVGKPGKEKEQQEAVEQEQHEVKATVEKVHQVTGTRIGEVRRDSLGQKNIVAALMRDLSSESEDTHSEKEC